MENQFSVSPQLLEQLYEFSTVKNYSSGELILEENASIRSIPIVTKGSIKVMRTEEDGREILLYYIKAGESCVMSFLGGLHGETSKVKAEVEEDAEILFLPTDKVTSLIKTNPEWLDYIFKMYHKRFEELLDMINELTFRKVDDRLINLLQKKSELTGSKIITATHEQLANELGTARVVVSRILKTFEEDHKLKLGRNRIELL
ncbi:Crp/Fnr family transcriptional regulator [Chryseobacterium taklimakanense]|uniref:Crp/Fnr family transcriptional regulator n=1 Tax=Chryseobacterium taklimakanense TaxID=536441 RepID=A0A3G8WJK7_9FLAO|nr:Crp/Fnr family transcriptional regulator [Chryseobacterium taklimakanense]AZI21365.1 Crp/Fnr family transcriptional regulator [Chryseobacterium taklimakanense]